MVILKKILISIFTIFIVFILTSCGNNIASYEFSYQSGNNDYKSNMYYSDDFFSESSTIYNPHLSTASLSFSMASFASTKYDYDKKSYNAKNLLESLGFENFSVNDYYKVKPTTDSIGLLHAMKKVGDYTLIAAGIRGSNYGSEWSSNFTLGQYNQNHYHKGFYEAATNYINELNDYIINNNITGKIKIWTSGYSRAGATCNLAIGRIVEALYNNSTLLPTSISVTKDDIYAYCFEAPMGVYYDSTLYPKSEIFNNIFCIINKNDPVPYVAMKELGFTRFGIDITLTDTLTDINFNDNILQVLEFYNNLENSGVLGDYKINMFEVKGSSSILKTISSTNEGMYNWTQGLYLTKFISSLTNYGIENRDNYNIYLEEGLRQLMDSLYKNGTPGALISSIVLQIVHSILIYGDFTIISDDIIHNMPKLMNDLKPYLYYALYDAMEIEIVKESIDYLFDVITKVLTIDPSLVLSLISKNNILSIASGHFPELCLAHLRAMDSYYTDNPIKYDLEGNYYLINAAKDDLDLEVRCNGSIIAKFENGKPISVDSAITIPYATLNGKIEVYLPKNSSYTITTNKIAGLNILEYIPNKLSYFLVSTTPSLNNNVYTINI